MKARPSIYFDGIYVVTVPEHIRELLDACQQALREHACIELNRGKTRIWNAAGEEPAHIADLRGHGEEPIWTGDWSPPRDRQGLLVLGTPLGTDEFAAKRTEHERLLTRIPEVPDLQAAWPLLHYGSAPRTTYLLRARTRSLYRCGLRCRCCLGSFVHSGDQLPAAAVQASQLAFGFGGLGLPSATADPCAAYRACQLARHTARNPCSLPADRHQPPAHSRRAAVSVAQTQLPSRRQCKPLTTSPLSGSGMPQSRGTQRAQTRHRLW